MALVAAEPTKVCRDCGRRKPWGDFYARSKWPDGTMRNPGAYCKRCHGERTKRWLANRPDVRLERSRRAYAAKRADPERWAAYLALNREWKRKHRVRQGRYATVRTFHRSPVGQNQSVDPAPFIAWLRTLGTDNAAIGRRVGMDSSQVRKYLNGDMVPTLDTVDRACLEAEGDPNLVNLMYPIQEAA